MTAGVVFELYGDSPFYISMPLSEVVWNPFGGGGSTLPQPMIGGRVLYIEGNTIKALPPATPD